MTKKISKHDIHFLDEKIKILGSRKFLLIFCGAMLFLGILLSILLNHWLWFSRFGSLVTISGIIMMSSPLFVRGIYRSHSLAGTFAEKDENGDTRTTTVEDRNIATNVLIGIITSIVGTAIWGFGDLVGCLF